MKQMGVWSVLIACCLTATAWAERFGEKQPADGAEPTSPSDQQVQVVPEDTYNPWQVYGYGAPYDHSAIAGYIAWPQVCVNGLWDNYCNEHHCWCYKGPKNHCGHHRGGCNACGAYGGIGAYGYGNGRFQENLVPVNSVRGNYPNGDFNHSGNFNTPTPAVQEPMLELQPAPEPATQPQAIPDAPAEEPSSALRLPRTNPIRQPMIPANWRGVR